MAERGLMRFFTREWDEGGLDDPTEERIDSAFHEHARELRPSLPSGLRLLVEGGGDFWLHDAQPLMLETDEDAAAVVLTMRALDYARGEESVALAIGYRNATLIGVEGGEIEQVVLSPRAQVLRSELDSLDGGRFVHRFSLWAPTYFEFAVEFADADVARA